MDVNDLEPKMTMNLSNFLSKKTHSAIKHHENRQEQDDDDDHREKKRRKKKKGWSFFLKNKLSSKISTFFGKISKGNRSPSSTNKSNNGSDPHNHDDVKEKQGKPTAVGEILFNGTRTTTSDGGGGGGGDGKKMGMNRSRSLKRGVVVVKKAKMKEMMVLERKQSMRRNGSIHRHHVEEGEELCKKRILMGFRCRPIYDQNGVISLD